MKKQYTNSRPTIPADIKRKIEIEAGHRCAIKNCLEHTYLEIHHINQNREDNRPENLILLCDKHHKMAHKDLIDRKALKEYKKLLNNQVLQPIQKPEWQIKKTRDIENLKSILFVMPINIIYEMLNDLPRYLRDYQVSFFDFFHEKFNSPNFYIYDEDLYTLLINIHSTWYGCVMYGQMYRHGNSGTYFFSNEGDAPLSKEQEIEWNKIEESRYLLKLNLDEFIMKIHNEYLDIDIETINQQGIQEYLRIKNEIFNDV